MTLEQIRAQWEKSLTLLAKEEYDTFTYLVVLKDKNGKYHCHRYMCFAPHSSHPAWEVSVDYQRTDADTTIKWLTDPRSKMQEED